MSANEPLIAAIGFITIVEDSNHGLFGGYLILNPAGRPVEFHCTAPVKPNRAQQILYGPTLQPYLYGEQIARTLIERSKILPRIVCLDQACAMCVRPLITVPTALVEKKTSEENPTCQIPWKDQTLSFLPEFPNDKAKIEECLQELLIEFDLLEPFNRIREAIAEAQKAAV